MRKLRPLLLAAVSCSALLTGSALSATRSSSGGYSRPSISAPSRLAPSGFSGGYSRSSTTSALVAPPKASAGDRAITQSSSGDALRTFRSAPSADDPSSKKRPGFLPDIAPPSPPIAAVAAAPAPTQTTVIVHHDHWWSGWGSPAPVYVPVPVQVPAATYAAPAPLDLTPKGAAAPQPARRHGRRWVWWVIGIGAAGGLAYLGWRHMQASDRKTTGAAAFVDNYAAVKTEAEPPKPLRYRAGMVIDIDAAALILGKEQILVDQHATGPATVLRVEALRIGGQAFVRLHTSRAFVQIHEAADGSIDDARLFTLRDTVSPSDADEWGFWLDDAEGVIGLGTFADKEGRLYARMWAPSDDPSNHIAPREIWGDTARGVAMLYGRPTGLPEPAPQVDLLLIETDEADGAARVNLYAGLDLDPASLSIV